MFVPFLKRAPFVRLIFPFALGIVLQSHMNAISDPYGLFACSDLSASHHLFYVISSHPLLPVILAAGCCLLILFLFSRLPLWVQFSYGWIKGVIIHLLMIALGCFVAYYADIRHSPRYFAPLLQSSDLLLVTIQEPLQEKPRSFKTTVKVNAVIRGDSVLPVKGFLLVYLQKDAAKLKCGNQLLLCNKLQPVQNTGNPGAFDYRQYCASQQIYHQAYLRTGEWTLYSNTRTGQIRDYCLHVLNKQIGEPEAGLAAALLIGYRYDLDKSMVQDYTNTGIVHIIAISGMHLALIYGSLLWLLQWIPSKILNTGIWRAISKVTSKTATPKGVLLDTGILKAVTILCFLWAFTWLTGASASVLRATVMFSFITIGRFILDRHTNVYNTLAASGFLLLCYNPHLLTDAGFQLSYLAVLSILICFRPLYQLLEIRNWLLNKIWEAIALTLAAQVFTLPICLYYFHQFPLYFLPANLLIVPLSTLVLYGEILLMLIPVHCIGTVLKWLMYYMNNIVAWIGNLPGALITEIHITLYGTFFCYGIIAGILCWCLGRWPKGLIIALTCCLLWAAWNMTDILKVYRQQTLIVYNIPAHTAVDVIHGRSVQSYGDSLAIQNTTKAILNTARATFRINHYKHSPSPLIQVGNKQLLVIDSAQTVPAGKKLRIDYLLLSHNPRVDIKQLDSLFTIGTLIFDASNTQKNIRKWKSDCYALTLRFFSVPDQGAYVVNF
jgi:competence protein ComEC